MIDYPLIPAFPQKSSLSNLVAQMESRALRWEHLCMFLFVISWSPGQSLARLASHFHSNQPVIKWKKLFPRLATNIWMACKSPDDLWHRTWCSVEGLHIQNAQLIARVMKTDYSVIASNFACLDDRADFRIRGPRVRWPEFRFRPCIYQLNDLSPWLPFPSFHFLSSINVYLQGLLRGSLKEKMCIGGNYNL